VTINNTLKIQPWLKHSKSSTNITEMHTMEIEFLRCPKIMKGGGGPEVRRKSQRGTGNVQFQDENNGHQWSAWESSETVS